MIREFELVSIIVVSVSQSQNGGAAADFEATRNQIAGGTFICQSNYNWDSYWNNFCQANDRLERRLRKKIYKNCLILFPFCSKLINAPRWSVDRKCSKVQIGRVAL